MCSSNQDCIVPSTPQFNECSRRFSGKPRIIFRRTNTNLFVTFPLTFIASVMDGYMSELGFHGQKINLSRTRPKLLNHRFRITLP